MNFDKNGQISTKTDELREKRMRFRCERVKIHKNG